jgi:hypothetical protein
MSEVACSFHVHSPPEATLALDLGPQVEGAQSVGTDRTPERVSFRARAGREPALTDHIFGRRGDYR